MAFHDTIRTLLPTDTNHADNFNEVYGQLLDNDKFIINTFSRKNLLIDGDFQLWLDGTSFVAPSNIYTATMWKCNGTGTVTKVANGMQITGTVTVKQIMETLEYNKISGKTVTLSYSLNGVITTSTFVASSATIINLTVTDKIINWIKLEVGDFRTLFESTPYGDELALSQRHYLKDLYCLGVATNPVFLNISKAFSVPMIATPTIASGTYLLRPYGEADISVTISSFGVDKNGVLYGNLSSGSLTSSKPYGLQITADARP